MFKIKQQLRRLYAVTAISSLQIAGASWVALLAARGFSLAEIGFAEGVFHFVSFLFEVPSGVIADVFGRKRSMVASQCMFAAASAAMLLYGRRLPRHGAERPGLQLRLRLPGGAGL